jgi:hypothetical protein
MSQLNKTQLAAENQSSFPNNNVGAITPTLLRGFNTDMIDSLVDEGSYNIDSASLSGSVASVQNQVNSLVLSGSGIVIQDEGITKGTVTALNFVGPTIKVNVTASMSNVYANTSGLATTGSNVFSGSQYITGSSGITGSFSIQGDLIINGTSYFNVFCTPINWNGTCQETI